MDIIEKNIHKVSHMAILCPGYCSVVLLNRNYLSLDIRNIRRLRMNAFCLICGKFVFIKKWQTQFLFSQ